MSPIVKVVEVKWSVGMGNPSLASSMQRVIDRLGSEGLGCVGVERLTDYQWLMLFARNVEVGDG